MAPEGIEGRIPRTIAHAEDPMLRKVLVMLIAVVAAATPFAVREAFADPVAPGIPECPDADPDTEDHPPTEETVCVSDDGMDPLAPNHRICSNDEVLFPGDGQELCVRTFDARRLPAPGLCAYLGDDGVNGPPVACFNAPANDWDGCVASLVGVNVLCV